MYRIDVRQTSIFPQAWWFDSEAPGWSFLFRLSEKIRIVSTIVFQIITLIFAISRKRSPEKEILIALCLAHPVILWLSPLNGVGGAGQFSFLRDSTLSIDKFYSAHLIWTDNQHIMRLKALFTIVFSEQYRQDLVTDGTTSLIGERGFKFSRTVPFSFC